MKIERKRKEGTGEEIQGRGKLRDLDIVVNAQLQKVEAISSLLSGALDASNYELSRYNAELTVNTLRQAAAAIEEELKKG